MARLAPRVRASGVRVCGRNHLLGGPPHRAASAARRTPLAARMRPTTNRCQAPAARSASSWQLQRRVRSWLTPSRMASSVWSCCACSSTSCASCTQQPTARVSTRDPKGSSGGAYFTLAQFFGVNVIEWVSYPHSTVTVAPAFAMHLGSRGQVEGLHGVKLRNARHEQMFPVGDYAANSRPKLDPSALPSRH
jgi:hypothetical protein